MNNEAINNDPLRQKSDKLAHLIYKLTKDFPREELYGVTSQLKRAALSIPLNIIEGFARKGSSYEYKHFLRIAYGSLKETKYLLHFVYKEKYLSKKDYKEALSLAEEIGKMLWSSIKTIENKISKEEK